MRSRSLSRPVVLALAAARMAADAWPGRRRASPASPRRILIAHHLLLGDTIMLTPLIAKCRARWPAAEIVMTCPAPSRRLVRGATLRRARASLRSARDRNARAARVRCGLRSRARAGRQPAVVACPVARCALDRRVRGRHAGVQELADRRIPALPRYADGVGRSRCRPRRRPADLLPYRASDWPAPEAAPFDAPATPYAVLHVGAGSQLRLWPAERWREIGRRLVAQGYAVVLSAGPGEHALLDPDRYQPPRGRAFPAR